MVATVAWPTVPQAWAPEAASRGRAREAVRMFAIDLLLIARSRDRKIIALQKIQASDLELESEESLRMERHRARDQIWMRSRMGNMFERRRERGPTRVGMGDLIRAERERVGD